MWLLPVPRGPNSHRLLLFSTSGIIRASRCHFTRSLKQVGSMPVERSSASIHCSSVNAFRPANSSSMSMFGIWIGLSVEGVQRKSWTGLCRESEALSIFEGAE